MLSYFDFSICNFFKNKLKSTQFVGNNYRASYFLRNKGIKRADSCLTHFSPNPPPPPKKKKRITNTLSVHKSRYS